MHDNVVASLNTMVELQQQLRNKEAPSLPTPPPVVYRDAARVDTLTSKMSALEAAANTRNTGNGTCGGQGNNLRSIEELFIIVGT